MLWRGGRRKLFEAYLTYDENNFTEVQQSQSAKLHLLDLEEVELDGSLPPKHRHQYLHLT